MFREKRLLNEISLYFFNSKSWMLTCGGVYHPLSMKSIVEYQKEPKIPEQSNRPINLPEREAVTLEPF